ncbi:hypothetical protein CCP3SC15_1300005 [Gammaproteobacteria bacterium]
MQLLDCPATDLFVCEEDHLGTIKAAATAILDMMTVKSRESDRDFSVGSSRYSLRQAPSMGLVSSVQAGAMISMKALRGILLAVKSFFRDTWQV